ncbi:MAG: HD-GYP domain-containing protein, partial [Sedimentibacter sp.]
KNAILVSLKKMLHDKNFGTEGHDLRMKKMCEKLGKKLDLSDSDIHKLVLLAGLHDIGKAAIPIQLLMEPELLTEEDRKEMQNHSAIGFRIANSNSDINQIAEGILYHHERWDGKGYPSGLIGKKIPLEARMVSIVDAYDDMVNDSPYKKAITRDEAIDELRRNKGTKFDPYLVDAFIETILEKD